MTYFTTTVTVTPRPARVTRIVNSVPDRDPVQVARLGNLYAYINLRRQEGWISATTEAHIQFAWTLLQQAIGGLPVPDGSPGPDGRFLLCWEQTPDYLELEFFPDHDPESYYRHDVSGKHWGADWKMSTGADVPDEVQTLLGSWHDPVSTPQVVA